MTKLNPIEYIEDTLSHHPKTILLWMTQGIVINGERYTIKEFRLKDDKLYAVISDNKYIPKYFEVQLCPDEETLKRILALVTEKEQVLESTRETITIKHGTNGTSETTKVDTNPQKVLEHENLISDSEYITLNHQTGENTTHIQTAKLKEELTNLHQNKQDVLIAGNGITIQGQTISSTGGGGKQNTENYYICLPDVSGVVTLTKFENDIVIPYDKVKGVLEYSIYLYFNPSEQGYAGKPIEGPIKNITDADHGEGGIYTDVTNPTIFSGLYEVYPTAGIGSPDHDSGNFTFYYDGDSLSVTCDTRKAPPGHVYNITGKTLLVEKIEHGGGGGDIHPVNAV